MRQSEGTIDKRGPNRFRARITVRSKEYSKTFSTAGEAEKWLEQLRLSSDEDSLIHRKYVQQRTVGELLTKFRDEVASKRPSLESRRREVSRCNFLLSQQPQICTMKAINLQPRHIATYIGDRYRQGASDASIRAELAIIRRTYTLAGGAWGYGIDQPVRKSLMPPPPPSRERRLSVDEFEVLMRAAYTYENTLGGNDRIPIGLIIYFAINTAMRRDEIASLTWDRIEIFPDGFGIATLPQLRTKTKKTREAPLVPALVVALLSLPSATMRKGSVFEARYGAIGTAWHRVLKLAGLYVSKKEVAELKKQNPRNDYGLRLHDLRHEGTSRFFEIYGLQKMLVQSITGHSSEAMTDRYAHLETRPMILRQMREVHAKNGLDQVVSPISTIGNTLAIEREANGNARLPSQALLEKSINPLWKALRRDAIALRAEVWRRPIEDLADAMGISDVAVHKACAKLKIDKPPRGYWLRGIDPKSRNTDEQP